MGSFNYVFNYTDHLGNVRVSYAKDPLVGNRVKILEENHYYAFGLKHKNYNVERLDFDQFPDTGVELVPIPAVANASYNYKYNGKELQEELGLNWLDYGWRNYDPAISRWVTPDPLLNDLDFTFDDSQVDEDDEEEVYEAIITKAENGDGIFNPNNLNSYGYGYNNPVSFDDPDGRCVPCIVIVALLYSSIADAPTRNPQADAKGRAAIKEIQNTHLSLLIPGSGSSKPVTAVLNVAKRKATEKVKEQVKKVVEKTAKSSSKYDDKTIKLPGKKPSTTNKSTDVTKKEFEKNLEKSGYDKSKSKDGKVKTYTKDGKSYTTRKESKSGGATADFRKDANSKKVNVKIRLREKK